MDKILKETMFRELKAKLKELEDIIEKYDTSEEVVHTTCIGISENVEDGDDWSILYAWNYKGIEDLEDMLVLQAEAYIAEVNKKLTDDGLHGDSWASNILNGLFLN